MTNAYSLREHFTLGNYNTTITRAEFEHSFTKTKENVTVTFNGWDGKSYDGESRSARVLRSNIPGYEDVRFISLINSAVYGCTRESSSWLRMSIPPATILPRGGSPS